MSLINDMLRDLDRRGVRDPGRARAGERRDSERALGPGGSSGLQLSAWLPAVGAFVLVAGLVLWEQRRAPESEPEADLSETEVASGPSVVLVPNYYPELLEAMRPPESKAGEPTSGETEPGAPDVAEPEHVPDPEPEPELSALEKTQIRQLMAEAELAFERDRLTSPIEDNAYARYQQVLELAPGHHAALTGITRITRRYLDLAEDYIEQGEALRAQVLVRRAETVQESHPDIPRVTQRLEAMSSENAAVVSNSQPVPAEAPSGHSAEDNIKRAKEKENRENKENRESQHLEVSPNAAFQDEQTARQARELLREGRHHSARLRLEKVLEAHPRPVQSAALLAGLYIDQGDTGGARALLDGADYLPPAEHARLSARLALALGNEARAIELLEERLPQGNDDEGYRAMLAGLYYRVERHPEAVASYRRLLDTFGAKPGYWLGLALALDAQDQDASALESFRRALSGSAYQAPEEQEVRAYIEQRIAALTGSE